MEPSKAIELIDNQLKQIPELKKTHRGDPCYDEWYMITKSILKKYFGEKSDQVKSFEQAGRAGIYLINQPDSHQLQAWYLESLDREAAVLRASKKGIELLMSTDESKKGKLSTPLENFEDLDIEKLTVDEKRVLKEALSALEVKAYTPCALACRAVFESIIKRTVATNNLKPKGPGLRKQIEAIENAKLVKKNHHKQLIEITKYFGEESQHDIRAKFDQRKCALLINSNVNPTQ
jgi:hypothetical protein